MAPQRKCCRVFHLSYREGRIISVIAGILRVSVTLASSSRIPRASTQVMVLQRSRSAGRLNEMVLARAAKARRDKRQFLRGGREREGRLTRTHPNPIPDFSHPLREREKPRQRTRRPGFHLT
jgi:hypothetical protein